MTILKSDCAFFLRLVFLLRWVGLKEAKDITQQQDRISNNNENQKDQNTYISSPLFCSFVVVAGLFSTYLKAQLLMIYVPAQKHLHWFNLAPTSISVFKRVWLLQLYWSAWRCIAEHWLQGGHIMQLRLLLGAASSWQCPGVNCKWHGLCAARCSRHLRSQLACWHAWCSLPWEHWLWVACSNVCFWLGLWCSMCLSLSLCVRGRWLSRDC